MSVTNNNRPSLASLSPPGLMSTEQLAGSRGNIEELLSDGFYEIHNEKIPHGVHYACPGGVISEHKVNPLLFKIRFLLAEIFW